MFDFISEYNFEDFKKWTQKKKVAISIRKMAGYGLVPKKNIWDELLRHIGHVCKKLTKFIS